MRDYYGIPIEVNSLIPEDQVVVIAGRMYAARPTYNLARYGCRDPLFSRHTIGNRELERDRRRHG